jgi:hypothetical protein
MDIITVRQLRLLGRGDGTLFATHATFETAGTQPTAYRFGATSNLDARPWRSLSTTLRLEGTIKVFSGTIDIGSGSISEGTGWCPSRAPLKQKVFVQFRSASAAGGVVLSQQKVDSLCVYMPG